MPVQGGTIHGRPIPEGYARVMVDQVEPGWEDLDLETPGGEGEEELEHAVHTWIYWNKRYIRLAFGIQFADTPTHGSEAAKSPAAQRGPSPSPR